MEGSYTDGSLRLRLRREAEGVGGWLSRAWEKRRVRWLTYLGVLALLAAFAFWFAFVRGLPSVDNLRAYEPPMPTNVRSIDGTPIHSYARERRVELSYDEYPPLMVKAFLAAEDRTFFTHGGVDYPGIAAAIVTNLKSGGRPVGASTITQQVAKNLLLTNQVSYVRKVKEAILAYRIEAALTKQQILEIYLNTIFLGRNAYGVEAASHAYFDKEIEELSLPQWAYLAILPKGPANYDPDRDTERALGRRNHVLNEMLKNDFITQGQHDAAVASPLMTVPRQTPKFERVGGYFVEEVRRQLIDKFGENAAAGPYSVYSGGLWVRTSFDPQLQQYAQEALRAGLIRYDGGRGWNGPIAHVDLAGGGWQGKFVNTNIGVDYQDWRAAIVISKDGGEATIGFADGRTGSLPSGYAQTAVRGVGGSAFAKLTAGDIIAVAPVGDSGVFALKTIPKVSGGMVVEQPGTGRVLAMQGGFDSRLQSFNRATQAERQPGSTIKPIVYSSALENGMTPASIIVDGPFCVDQGARLGKKCFRNFGGGGGSGPHTMRWGIEQSRNLMTVRAGGADRHGSCYRHDAAARRRALPAVPRLRAGRGRNDRDADGQRLYDAGQSGPRAAAVAGRLRPGPPRQGHLPGQLARVRRLQRARLQRQGDAAPGHPLSSGDRPADRVPDGPHHRRRHPARHRDRAARPRPADLRQDRNVVGADRRVVHRRHAADRGRAVPGL